MPWCPSPVVQKGLKYSFPWSNIFCFHDIRCTNYIEIYLEILQDIPCFNINFLTTLYVFDCQNYMNFELNDFLCTANGQGCTPNSIRSTFYLDTYKACFCHYTDFQCFLTYHITESIFIRLSIYCSGILVWIFNIMSFAVEKLFYVVSLH